MKIREVMTLLACVLVIGGCGDKHILDSIIKNDTSTTPTESVVEQVEAEMESVGEPATESDYIRALSMGGGTQSHVEEGESTKSVTDSNVAFPNKEHLSENGDNVYRLIKGSVNFAYNGGILSNVSAQDSYEWLNIPNCKTSCNWEFDASTSGIYKPTDIDFISVGKETKLSGTYYVGADIKEGTYTVDSGTYKVLSSPRTINLKEDGKTEYSDAVVDESYSASPESTVTLHEGSFLYAKDLYLEEVSNE